MDNIHTKNVTVESKSKKSALSVLHVCLLPNTEIPTLIYPI